MVVPGWHRDLSSGAGGGGKGGRKEKELPRLVRWLVVGGLRSVLLCGALVSALLQLRSW